MVLYKSFLDIKISLILELLFEKNVLSYISQFHIFSVFLIQELIHTIKMQVVFVFISIFFKKNPIKVYFFTIFFFGK